MQQLIQNCAHSYLGTRFKHQGRLKKCDSHGGGIDCLGLLVGVARECDLRGKNGEILADFDQQDYSHRPDTAALQQKLSSMLDNITIQEIRAGDVALFEIDGMPQHLGIISDLAEGHGIIHAYAPARAVVEHALDTYWLGKIIAVYRLPHQEPSAREAVSHVSGDSCAAGTL